MLGFQISNRKTLLIVLVICIVLLTAGVVLF